MSSGQKWWADKEQEEYEAEVAAAEKVLDETLLKLKEVPHAIRLLRQHFTKEIVDKQVESYRWDLETKYGLRPKY
jgi:hypothetical protein